MIFRKCFKKFDSEAFKKYLLRTEWNALLKTNLNGANFFSERLFV